MSVEDPAAPRGAFSSEQKGFRQTRRSWTTVVSLNTNDGHKDAAGQKDNRDSRAFTNVEV